MDIVPIIIRSYRYTIWYLIIWYKLQMNQTDFQYTKLVSKTKCLFEEWFFFQLPWFKEAVTIDTTVYLRIHDGYQKTVSSEMDSRDITNCLISWKFTISWFFLHFFRFTLILFMKMLYMYRSKAIFIDLSIEIYFCAFIW